MILAFRILLWALFLLILAIALSTEGLKNRPTGPSTEDQFNSELCEWREWQEGSREDPPVKLAE